MMTQFDWTKSKPTLLDRLLADVQLHERSLELAFINRRYSIHRSDADFQASLNLIRERLALKCALLNEEIERAGG